MSRLNEFPPRPRRSSTTIVLALWFALWMALAPGVMARHHAAMAAGVEVCSVDGVRFVKSDDTRAAAQADGCGDVCCASPMALPAEAPAAAGTAWVAVSPAAAPLPAVPPLPWTAARPRGPPSFA